MDGSSESMVRDYTSGMSSREVMEKYKVGFNTMKTSGVKMRSRGQQYLMPDEEKFRIDCAKMRWHELEKEYGVKWSVIKSWKRKLHMTTGKKEDRLIFTKVVDGDCWECESHERSKGYPRTKRGLVAKVLWMQKNGEFPEGKLIRHLCAKKWCVNPDHVVPGTQFENLVDNILDGTFTGGMIARALREGVIVRDGDYFVRSADGKRFLRAHALVVQSVNEGGEQALY